MTTINISNCTVTITTQGEQVEIKPEQMQPHDMCRSMEPFPYPQSNQLVNPNASSNVYLSNAGLISHLSSKPELTICKGSEQIFYKTTKAINQTDLLQLQIYTSLSIKEILNEGDIYKTRFTSWVKIDEVRWLQACVFNTERQAIVPKSVELEKASSLTSNIMTSEAFVGVLKSIPSIDASRKIYPIIQGLDRGLTNTQTVEVKDLEAVAAEGHISIFGGPGWVKTADGMWRNAFYVLHDTDKRSELKSFNVSTAGLACFLGEIKNPEKWELAYTAFDFSDSLTLRSDRVETSELNPAVVFTSMHEVSTGMSIWVVPVSSLSLTPEEEGKTPNKSGSYRRVFKQVNADQSYCRCVWVDDDTWTVYKTETPRKVEYCLTRQQIT